MVGLAFCILAFVCTYAASRRGLGTGLQVLLVVGYTYGLMRGRYPDGFTHFAFDAALIALYLGYLMQQPVTSALEHRSKNAMIWMRVLMIWPAICMAYSPMLEDSQPMIIQLVGLRAWTLMLPSLVLGARLQRVDLDRLAPTVALLNLFALVIAAIEFRFGVDAVVPLNRSTEVIYATKDIAAAGEIFHRIPSCFIHAAGYGASMLFSIPLVLHGLEGTKRTRILCVAGLAAAGIGIFLCGSRSCVVILCIASILTLVSLRMRFSSLLGFAIVAAGIYYLVVHNERLQRFETLADADAVQARLAGSANMSFITLLGQYPLGAGLASAFGTSVPFFMRGLATRSIIGIENEYGRILAEQGIIGLLLYLGFVLWLFSRTKAPQTSLPMAGFFGTALVFVYWLGAFIGAGALSNIPGTPMFLLLCGLRAASPAREVATRALRHVGYRGRAQPQHQSGTTTPAARANTATS